MANEHIRVELGIEVAETMKEAAFLHAIKVMKDTCFAIIVSEPPGSLTSQQACAKLQVLNGFLDELKALVNDGKVAENQQRKK